MGSPNLSNITLAFFAISDGESAKEKNFIQFREIHAAEMDQFRNAISDVNAVLDSFFTYVNRAMEDLEETLSGVKSRSKISPLGSDVYAWRVEVEFRILNYCAAVVAYYDRVLAEMKRKHRGDEDFAAASGLFSKLFDDSLAYRVVYNLRNALIHGSRNLLDFRMEATLPEGSRDPKDALVSISVPLSREKFGRGSANARVRNEVRGLEFELDVLELCKQSHKELRALDTALIPLLHPDLDKHSRYLNELIYEASQNGGYPMAMSYEPSRFKETCLWTLLPREVFHYVRKQFEAAPGSSVPYANY